MNKINYPSKTSEFKALKKEYQSCILNSSKIDLTEIQNFLTSKLFPLLYRDELALFNSSFNKAEINLLLTTFTLILYASFIGYRQLNNKLFVACKNLFILFNFASIPIFSLFIIE